MMKNEKEKMNVHIGLAAISDCAQPVTMVIV